MDVGVEQLVDIARGVAGRLGASGPISIQHVATTRGADAELPGRMMRMLSGFDRDAPCYVVLIQGTFNPPPTPPRHAGDMPPKPRELHSAVLTVDGKTGHVVGSWTIPVDEAVPDITTLGEVIVDATDATALDDWNPLSPAELEALRTGAPSASADQGLPHLESTGHSRRCAPAFSLPGARTRSRRQDQSPPPGADPCRTAFTSTVKAWRESPPKTRSRSR
jgi:hypothetical protein